ncbi:MAG TPA: type 2 lanthipeptide synthetase LanM, partial [Thermoanaerobaculia bacterium]
MPPSPLVSFADACRALTLAERAEALRAGGLEGAAPDSSRPDPVARWRFDQWRALSPFRSDERFSRRLALQGLDADQFASLLATPASVAGAALTDRPCWMRWMSALEPGGLGRVAGEHDIDPALAAKVPQAAGGGPDLDPFLAPVRPWIDQARARLGHGLVRLAAASGAEPLFAAAETGALLAANLPARLVPVLARTLVLELQVARHQGLLSGESAAARFTFFIARLGQHDVAAALLGEYPVLAREVLRELAQWVDGSLELLACLAADAPRLIERFFHGRHPGLLSALDGGAGDRHRGGRSVRVLTFAGGSRLVYKPRPLAVERHFQQLLAWLGDSGDGAPRTVAVLDRGDYGWMEFVAAQGCSGPDEVVSFYRRLGGLLAVLYVLEATDCHFENLIAAGGQPVLVDLETLFQPRIAPPQVAEPDKRLAGQLFSDSVLRIGLLPFLVGAGGDFEGVDLSGIAAVAGRPSPRPVMTMAGAGTDEMHVVRERLPLPGGSNVPFLGGREGESRQEMEAAEHTEELAEGFTAVYRRLAERRAELLAP